jgi:hypothetical protein
MVSQAPVGNGNPVHNAGPPQPPAIRHQTPESPHDAAVSALSSSGQSFAIMAVQLPSWSPAPQPPHRLESARLSVLIARVCTLVVLYRRDALPFLINSPAAQVSATPW